VEFLAEYASFLAKTATLVIAFLVVLSAIAGMRGKGRRKAGGSLQVTRMNEFYKDLRERLESGLLEKNQLKALRKQQAKDQKKTQEGSGGRQAAGVRAGLRRRYQGLRHREPAP